jgi:glycine/D-amino acid oxidase-like deaminating enzyme
MIYDYLVVGQGLAGTLASFELLQLGKKVLVADQLRHDSSSRIAAGLYTPITGKNMVLTWKADKLFPQLEYTYRKLEKILGELFLHELPVFKPFIDLAEYHDWMGKSSYPDYQEYIHRVVKPNETVDDIENPYGGVLLKRSGYLEVTKLLDSYRRWLNSQGFLTETEIDPELISFNEQGVNYLEKPISRMIIWCTGTCFSIKNKKIILPLKGEILELSMERKPEVIFNRKVFRLPLSGKRVKVGSTYDRKDLTNSCNLENQNLLVNQLKQWCNSPLKLLDHSCGFRPSTYNRRPVVGLHPQHKLFAVFNGLGTKGVSLAPYFAKQLAEHLEYSKEIDPEVQFNRYF